MSHIPFREISTLAILVPITLNLLVVKTAGLTARLFFIFLLIGLVTDLVGWYVSFYTQYVHVLLYISIVYSIIEAVLFSWLLYEITKSSVVRTVIKVLFFAIALWIGFILFRRPLISGGTSYSTLFDAAYQVVIAFLSGYCLLQVIEQNDHVNRLPYFWIVLGIFFYCFSTFFIFIVKAVIDQNVANRLWFLHNLINITTYVLYSIGIWRMPKTSQEGV